MTLPFTPDAFFDVLAAYNERLWPYALALWLLTAGVVIVVARGSPAPRWLIPGLLALHWAWSGLAYHAAFFSTINPAAWMFAALFLCEAGLWLWYGVGQRRFQLSHDHVFRQVVSWGLIAYAMVYPAIAVGEGHAFPRAPTFGVPCPTTILTIGFLLAADRSYPWAIALIPLLWAVVGGSAAFLFGVRADLVLLAAGAVLALDLSGLVTGVAAIPQRP